VYINQSVCGRVTSSLSVYVQKISFRFLFFSNSFTLGAAAQEQ